MKQYFFLLFFSARTFNVYPKKGAILVGSDADIIILNPNSSFHISAKSHHSRSDTNVYEGRRGKVVFISMVSTYIYIFIQKNQTTGLHYDTRELYTLLLFICVCTNIGNKMLIIIPEHPTYTGQSGLIFVLFDPIILQNK